MRGVVADQLQRARVLAAEELNPGIAFDFVVEVGERPVERHRDRALRERRRNALRDIQTGNPVWKLPTRAVGKGQRDRTGHDYSCCSLLRTSAGKLRCQSRYPSTPSVATTHTRGRELSCDCAPGGPWFVLRHLPYRHGSHQR